MWSGYESRATSVQEILLFFPSNQLSSDSSCCAAGKFNHSYDGTCPSPTPAWCHTKVPGSLVTSRNEKSPGPSATSASPLPLRHRGPGSQGPFVSDFTLSVLRPFALFWKAGHLLCPFQRCVSPATPRKHIPSSIYRSTTRK